MSTETVMPSNHLILCHPLLLLPSTFPTIRVFSNESALHIRWSKYWSSVFSTSPSNKYPGLISLGLTGLIKLIKLINLKDCKMQIFELEALGEDVEQPWLWHINSRIKIVATLCKTEVAQSCPTLCDPMGSSLQCTKLLHPWDFQDKSTGVRCHFLLQGIFPSQGSNPGLSHCRQTFYHLSHQGSLVKL